jgi:hypothetical protein
MLQEAEENAAFDKSKKSLVNITYELDNLLVKGENLFNSSLFTNKDIELYFEEILKEMKSLYKSAKFKDISSEIIENLRYAYNLVVLEYFKNELQKKSSSSEKSRKDPESGSKGVVIDVTEE